MGQKISLVALQKSYTRYRDELEQSVKAVFADAAFIGGTELELFEAELSQYLQAQLTRGEDGVSDPTQPHVHAIGCASGTDALLLPLMAWKIGPGDEVITTPYTFIATAEVIALSGATPVFVDVRADNYLIDVAAVKAAITERTKAIIPVNLFGVPADMDPLVALAATYDVRIIEDAAQSFGALYHGTPSGILASPRGVGATSFFPTKPLGAAGDGGAMFTQDASLATTLRMLLNHGQTKRYTHEIIGRNARLDALQAAVLRVKLKHFNAELVARRRIAARYDRELARQHVLPQSIPSSCQSSYAQYSFTCHSFRARETLIARLNAAEIGYGLYYPIPLHLQEAFASLGYSKGAFPVSEKLAETMLSIPVHPFLSEAEQSRVIETVNLES